MNASSVPDTYPRTTNTAGRLRWPWRSRCTLSIQAGGQRYLPHIRTAMQSARRSICIELYMCNSGVLFDEWFAVFSAAVQRGVSVQLLLDDIGSAALSRQDRQRLRDAGVTLLFFNPVRMGHLISALVRDHRKLIIVDDERAWVGGMGIDDRYDPRLHGDEAWMDAMLACRGPLVADFRMLFDQAWRLADAGPVSGAVRWRLTAQRPEPVRQDRRNTTWARVNAARGGRRNPLIRTLVRRILRARTEVWLCTPYFLPPRSLYKALLIAARRGVSVHLTLGGEHTDHPAIRYAGQHYYQRLLDAGVQIHEYQARFLHLKAARADNWSTMGSFNYDIWNSSWNLEANVETVDQGFAGRMAEMKALLDRESVLVTREAWQERGLLTRTRTLFWHTIGLRFMKLVRGIWATATAHPAAD
ncbi:phosphatidylserine/phosphatidylglycerophosphate/cardiolipin synthase family protein [Alcanivorax sp. JB21]|uniref:phospholipase D-like domain-containing protein n=1 Tax=Alcanivorax limicola TaxID=2874102 RepID=UPI001CBE0DD5|nr:phosphatidylserine/phosphatidylglycerophosphate/cardiolipin synthase family protein [Alcanivorax limicola]MBZ2187660.1 phosphatidylserine/phosphatidylglycerophosphate/cardiolipin synthase family protein [Alcanivorax limicola]